MRALAVLPLVLFLSVAARADDVDDKWRAFLSDTNMDWLSEKTQTAKFNWFVEQQYGPAVIQAAEAIPATEGEAEQQRKGQLVRTALAWARPREDALGDLVLSRAYRQGLGVEANLFESLRLLRRPYQAQIPEALEMLIVALDQGTGLPQNTAGAMEATARLFPAFRMAGQPPITLSYQLLMKPIETLRDYRVPAFLDPQNVGWIRRRDLGDLYSRIRTINNRISPGFLDFQKFILDMIVLQNNPSQVRIDAEVLSGETAMLVRTMAAAHCMSGLATSEAAIFSSNNGSNFRPIQMNGFISCSLTGKIPNQRPTDGMSLLEKYKDDLGSDYQLLAAGAARFGLGRTTDLQVALRHLDQALATKAEDSRPRVMRGIILDLDGPLTDRAQARADLTLGGKACLDTFFKYQKEKNEKIIADRLKWQTTLTRNAGISFKIDWSPLTGVISGDGRRAMAECAQTALLRAAELGSAEAAYAVTRLPDDAPGVVPLSNERRQALLEQAVDGDIADAYGDLAELYQNRVVVYAVATPTDGQAHPAPSREVLCSGWQIIEQCLPRPIRPLLEKGVAHNSPGAQARLGALLVRRGNTSPEEVARGWLLLQQAAESRDPPWLYVFAREALSRSAPVSLRSAALDALTAAADMNYSPAQYDLAKLELARDQTPGEQRRSLMRLYAAAQAGHSEARKALADAFDKGIGLGAPSAWLGTLWRKGELP
jgi:TPR repeat protein